MLSTEIAFDMCELERRAETRRAIPPTPQYVYPKLSRRAGCTVWVKHENYTPTGAFKVRGGLVAPRSAPPCDSEHTVSATRGTLC